MLKFLKTAIENFRAATAFDAMETRWAKAGAPAPRFLAAKELGLRALLEDFRDYASESFDRDGSTIEQIKTTWAENILKPTAAAIGAEKATMLKEAVEAMPPAEMFHPATYRRWCAAADAVTPVQRPGALQRRVFGGGDRQ